MTPLWLFRYTQPALDVLQFSSDWAQEAYPKRTYFSEQQVNQSMLLWLDAAMGANSIAAVRMCAHVCTGTGHTKSSWRLLRSKRLRAARAE
jgi:hypothetical protein